MTKNLIYSTSLVLVLIFSSCQSKENKVDFVTKNVQLADAQYRLHIDLIDASGKVLNPRTVENGKIKYISPQDWTSGFFAGSLWYLYELTGDEFWKGKAIRQTEALDTVQYLTWHHDVGFMIGNSFGNGIRFGGMENWKKIVVQTAKSLSTRFRPGAGIIQSWNVDRGWQSERGWACPVIIDNMMNLELLFNATEFSGDSSFYKIAVSHADKTLEHHFRTDNSSWHVVDYNPENGEIRGRYTAQGYADETAWARGQAWALYGYTITYRETGDKKYLKQAQNIFEFIANNPRLPEDGIPYWDFDAPKIPNEPRDASAAAIIASALYEMSTYERPDYYKGWADKIVNSLASPAYHANQGENGNFILMHSVGSIPHNAEIDVPLNYADYYFLEALSRKSKLEKP